MAEPVEPSEATRLLSAAFEKRGAQSACARRTGISQAYLSQLANAERSPSRKIRKVLEGDKELEVPDEDVRGIPRVAWEQPPRRRRKKRGSKGRAA